eukprot:scaffold6.g2664.t1
MAQDGIGHVLESVQERLDQLRTLASGQVAQLVGGEAPPALDQMAAIRKAAAELEAALRGLKPQEADSIAADQASHARRSCVWRASGGRRGAPSRRKLPAGGFCAPGCTCANCMNSEVELGQVQAARAVVLAKDPRAFETKVTATEGHKRGCRCKRSKCLKKYCECFSAGARCNPDVCGCEGCRNTADGPVAALLGGLGAGAVAATSSDGPSGDDDYVPTVLARRAGGRGRARPGRQRAPAAARPHVAEPQLLFIALEQAAVQQKQLVQAAAPPLAALPMPPALSCEQEAAAVAAAMLASMPLPSLSHDALAPEAAALATLSGALCSGPASSLMLNPLAAAAAAAATYAAAATMAEHSQLPQLAEVPALEESMADAALLTASLAHGAVPAPSAAKAAGLQASVLPATTPAVASKMPSALTSHLSDMLVDCADPDMRDTASSPAPHVAVAKLTAPCGLLAEGATLTGGATGRPPLPPALLRKPLSPSSAANSLSLGSGGSLDAAASQGLLHRSKRPRRAASGGVLGAVAAEAACWGADASPTLKRANSLPSALHGSGAAGRKQVSERVALLKKALAGDSAANAAHLHAPAGQPACVEDADAVSALFELSSSQC